MAKTQTTKMVVLDNDEIKIINKLSFPLTFLKKWEVQISNTIDLGKCMCCGGTSMIYFQGNIILFGCDKRISVKGCVYAHDKCPGADACLNKEDYDPDFASRKKEKIKEIASKMFEIFDSVIISIEPETKELVADYYLRNAEYVVRTYDTDADLDDVYIISKAKDIIENRKKIEEKKIEEDLTYGSHGGSLRK